MKPAMRKPWMSVALLGFWAGCDAQAGEPYQGEPLLTMTGSVELALEVENEEALIPALGFRGDDDTVHLVDADATGEFPAEFTLNVYQPPPSASVYALDPLTGPGPRVATGYIGAITPDTPATFRLSTNNGGFSGCGLDETTGLNVCREIQTWCTSDDSACYTETTTCPDADNHPDDCVVTSEGDPELKLELEQRFAGLSENYVVVWLETPAPPGSYIAYALGERDRGLAQGYHLFEISEFADQEAAEEAADICRHQSTDLAAERTNERFDTSYTEEELSWLCDFPQDCSERENEIYAAYEAERYLALVELDCPRDETELRRVEDPASERISVRIGPDLKVF